MVAQKLLCAAVAVAVARSVIYGEAAPAVAAAGVVAVMFAWAGASRAGGGAAVSTQRRPRFHSFLVRRMGRSRRPVAVLVHLLLRPLAAPSFGAFWREWNPPLAYVTLFFVYRPVRRLLPRPAAVLLTFAASGLLLHDLPANGPDLFRGRADLSGSLLFALFGCITLLTDARGIDLSRRPAWVRVLANLVLLVSAFAIRRALRSVF